MTTTLAELKAEAARLNARIAELEGNNNRVTPPPVEERGVRVVELLPERTDSLPTLREMERLFTIVKQHSPWPQALYDRFDEHRPFRAFSSAFRWLQNVGRAERPNGKVALSYWADTCRMWLRARNSIGERDRARMPRMRRCCVHAGGPYSRLGVGIGFDRIRRQAREYRCMARGDVERHDPAA
jgi:hypothetical protein